MGLNATENARGDETDLRDALLGVVDALALEQGHAPEEHRDHPCLQMLARADAIARIKI